jgi:hypothetical protein
MPMDKSRYPADWDAISLRIRFERAGGVCEWPGCTAEHLQPHPETGSKVILTVAHLDHDATNNADTNLMAMCQLHHLRYDAQQHACHAAETRRRKRDAETGQLEL